ncbi:hypothetical protein EIN_326160 [Entamoeba invadens IP1]|uniref:Uncharacterized protein n=1 Tax=Entamoeba invadens IP1 TaxID=370355 RepID=L7FN30_ENTIV|nr:hypothetical protein EIN_326160 [Entamoeba invadens IP1]ELP87555.1 hypothetical protein EIN_326160 [Entamoeba invadens IP1]|eukprot:XP_004254326.1 hypothetical protein EIN_326160 [Entamoeba invadens IP1]
MLNNSDSYWQINPKKNGISTIETKKRVFKVFRTSEEIHFIDYFEKIPQRVTGNSFVMHGLEIITGAIKQNKSYVEMNQELELLLGTLYEKYKEIKRQHDEKMIYTKQMEEDVNEIVLAMIQITFPVYLLTKLDIPFQMKRNLETFLSFSGHQISVFSDMIDWSIIYQMNWFKTPINIRLFNDSFNGKKQIILREGEYIVHKEYFNPSVSVPTLVYPFLYDGFVNEILCDKSFEYFINIVKDCIMDDYVKTYQVKRKCSWDNKGILYLLYIGNSESIHWKRKQIMWKYLHMEGNPYRDRIYMKYPNLGNIIEIGKVKPTIEFRTKLILDNSKMDPNEYVPCKEIVMLGTELEKKTGIDLKKWFKDFLDCK